MRSLPARGAWIEIFPERPRPRRSPCRSPHGEHGLKYGCADQNKPCPKSLPARGAWIEMLNICKALESYLSLPARGAWIEMAF